MAKSKKRKPRSNAAMYKKMALERKMLNNAINADRSRVFMQGENIGYTNATIIILWLLRREYGFGKVRLTKFLHQITTFCGEYVLPAQSKQPEGEYQGITLEDMAEALKEECDIHIDWQRGLIDIDNILIVKEGEEHDGTAEADATVG